MDDLEEMMMMEAIRLSLASEEERARKEEKEAAKKAKKDEKEQAKQRKKDEKAARKGILFTTTSNGDGASSLMERARSNLSSIADDDDATSSGKGKDIERASTPPIGITRPDEETPRPYMPYRTQSETSQESLAASIPNTSLTEPFKRSHLRQMSTASSASSSIVEPSPSGSYPGSPTPPAGSLEPMFNYQSLAAMIDEENKAQNSSHVENTADSTSGERPGSLEELREGDGDGDASPEQPSPPLSLNGHSRSAGPPPRKGKEVENPDERHEDGIESAKDHAISARSEASKA